MTERRMDWQAIGLDVGVDVSRWLTGAENLHYGLWTGLAVNAGNLGAAQAAYTDKLLGYLPEGPLSILDIGGGAGETARRLGALGHRVEIVVPSPALAARCRVNAPGAALHETTFEAFETDRRFDLCLFSESFQYIPMDLALEKACALTRPGGHVLIADCFRAPGFVAGQKIRPPGGGHRFAAFEAALAALPVTRLAMEDITEAVAPSIDVEQGFYNILGGALTRVDVELTAKRPGARRILAGLIRMLMSKRRRERLDARLRGNLRTSAAFVENNRYVIALLQTGAGPEG